MKNKRILGKEHIKINNLTLSVLMTVYNEEGNINRVYGETKNVLERAKITYEIILVEGGSVDNSFTVLKKLSKKEKNCIVMQAGKNPASKAEAGLKIAKGKYIAFMCSDGQDDPIVLPKLVKILEQNKADFVKGKRIKRTFIERKIISLFFNGLVKILFNLGIEDINGHPKMFKRNFLKNVHFVSEHESIDLEIMLRAYKNKLRVLEIPIKERKRKKGNSSINVLIAFKMFIDVFSYKWGEKGRLLEKSIRKNNS